MASDLPIRRKILRLETYDYSQAGFYFVTICTHQRQPILSAIEDRQVKLTPAGEIVWREWFRTAALRPSIELFPDEFVIMPNHLHSILRMLPGNEGTDYLGRIVGQFKAASTKWINRELRTPSEHIWQRNYYEHIIRNDEDLERIQKYIQNNPLRWELDRFYDTNS